MTFIRKKTGTYRGLWGNLDVKGPVRRPRLDGGI